MFSRQAMLQSHDEVLKSSSTGEEVNPYTPDNTTAFSSRLDDSVADRPEKLTRVRLVQFHKNPNEPMVSTYLHALRAYLFAVLWWLKASRPTFYCCCCNFSLGNHSKAKWRGEVYCGADHARRNDSQTRWVLTTCRNLPLRRCYNWLCKSFWMRADIPENF